nr:hypothetical protein [Tanacetum cinerariifolium]
MHQIIEECCVEASKQQKQNMEKTMLDLVKIYHHKQFLFMHDNDDDLIESALDSKLLSINSINSQHLDKKEQEVKIVKEQPAERKNHAEKSLQNFRVALEDKRECDLLISENSPVCDNSDTFSDSKIDDDISIYDDDFEDIEYVEASLLDPEIASVEEENVVQQEEEEVDLENISQIQDVVLREKILSITCLISNIESLNDNSTLDRVLNYFEFDNSLLDNFLPEFETFYDHTEETRSEEADLFLFDDSIPSGIENVADDPEGDPDMIAEEISDKLNEDKCFDPGRGINVSTKIEDDDYFLFMFVIQFFLPYFIFPEVFPLLLSAESEDTIFDPGISD